MSMSHSNPRRHHRFTCGTHTNRMARTYCTYPSKAKLFGKPSAVTMGRTHVSGGARGHVAGRSLLAASHARRLRTGGVSHNSVSARRTRSWSLPVRVGNQIGPSRISGWHGNEFQKRVWQPRAAPMEWKTGKRVAICNQ